MTEPVAELRSSNVQRGPMMPKFLYWVIRWGLHAIISVVLPRRMHVSGKENVPREGGLLVISNHIATADPPLLGALFPRPLHFMAKVEWFKNPVIGYLARQFLCFPVVRHTADRSALRYTLALLQQGQAVAIYPEGTRSEDLQIHPPEAGAGFLARQAKVPILPVATWGGEGVLPKGSKFPRPAHAHIVYGKPFQLPEGKLSNQEAADYMMSKVAELLPDDYRGHYATWKPARAG
ncbi:MAG: lysophospholipid acyltransferase family protein [Candidatus Dormiibacterota bacterium]